MQQIPLGGYHKSDEAHDWEKQAGIHEGQIALDKPDHLLWHIHWLGWCVASGGLCLLHTNEQCAAAAKKPNKMLGYNKMESPAQIKVVFTPTWHLWGHTRNAVLFWSLLCRKMWTGCRGSREGPQREPEDWEVCHVRKGCKNWVCSFSLE